MNDSEQNKAKNNFYDQKVPILHLNLLLTTHFKWILNENVHILLAELENIQLKVEKELQREIENES